MPAACKKLLQFQLGCALRVCNYGVRFECTERVNGIAEAKLVAFVCLQKRSDDHVCQQTTRRERLMSALYVRLKKRLFGICIRFHEKLPFLDLDLLFTKTQLSSDITSKVQI